MNVGIEPRRTGDDVKILGLGEGLVQLSKEVLPGPGGDVDEDDIWVVLEDVEGSVAVMEVYVDDKGLPRQS